VKTTGVSAAISFTPPRLESGEPRLQAEWMILQLQFVHRIKTFRVPTLPGCSPLGHLRTEHAPRRSTGLYRSCDL
jgi:hypothetical protein